MEAVSWCERGCWIALPVVSKDDGLKLGGQEGAMAAKAKAAKSQKKARSSKQTRTMAEKIGQALAVLAADLPNPFDESTDYFRAFSAPFGVDDPINEASLRVALKVSSRYELDISDLTNLGEGYGEPEESCFRVLQSAMGATLREMKLVYARGPAVVRVRTWILGRPAAGGLAGLQTETTET